MFGALPPPPPPPWCLDEGDGDDDDMADGAKNKRRGRGRVSLFFFFSFFERQKRQLKAKPNNNKNTRAAYKGKERAGTLRRLPLYCTAPSLARRSLVASLVASWCGWLAASRRCVVVVPQRSAAGRGRRAAAES